MNTIDHIMALADDMADCFAFRTEAETSRHRHFLRAAIEQAITAAKAEEREACAKVCDEIANKPSNMVLGVAINCASAIRERNK